MGLRHCRLKENEQRKLAEYFVLEVTARAAAEVLDIQTNTAVLFYRKLRIIIADQLEVDASEFRVRSN